jgi:hypothetical protein
MEILAKHFIQKFTIDYYNFSFTKISFLFDFFRVTLYESLISKFKISWATVKKPQEPSHLVLSEYPPRCF